MIELIKPPPPNEIKRRLKSLACIDAIICQEWDDRYFSYNSKWYKNEEMGSMRDGQGDDFFILFADKFTAIKGKKLKSPLAKNESVFNAAKKILSKDFARFFEEPAFSMKEATYIYWNLERDSYWNKIESDIASPDDGSDDLILWLTHNSLNHAKWIEQYYELQISSKNIELIFNFCAVDYKLLSLFNFEGDLDGLKLDLIEIGYPYVL